MSVECFWLEPTDKLSWRLRRYSQHHEGGYTCADGWHEAWAPVGTIDALRNEEGFATARIEPPTPHDDPRWPAFCEHGCGYGFKAIDAWQDCTDLIWRRADTGDLTTLRDAPDGAMWDAYWLHYRPGAFAGWPGADGYTIQVKCPGGRTWTIDSRASNCTMRDDNEHRCWVRHGTVPKITVDKDGLTCQAGGGSIQTGNYHGFLREGRFT